MRDVWVLARQRMAEIVQRPGNLILALGVTILLSVLAAPAGGESAAPIWVALSGRLFLLVTGISGLFGYAFSGLRRRGPEVATDEIVSLRAFVLGKVVSAALLATCLTWLAVAVMLSATFIRHEAVLLPEPWVLGYAIGGPLIISGAFAGAMTMARLLLRRGGRTAVAWTLFLPWMLTFASFRLLGGFPSDTSYVVLLAFLSALILCAIEAALFLRFVPNRLTMRPQ